MHLKVMNNICIGLIYFLRLGRGKIINLKPINVKRLCILCEIDIYFPPTACKNGIDHCTGAVPSCPFRVLLLSDKRHCYIALSINVCTCKTIPG